MGLFASDCNYSEVSVDEHDSDPYMLTNLADTLYFSANDGSNGLEIWSSDGTEEGTVRTSSLSGSGIYPFEMMNSTTHYFVKIVSGNNFVLFIHSL